MFRRLFLSTLCFVVISSPVWSYNAQFDHEQYRRQLNTAASRQRIDNQKYIRYYKGPANSSYFVPDGRSYYSAKDKIYEKKGIKFKVDSTPKKVESVQEDKSKNTEENKSQSSRETKVTQSAASKTMTKSYTVQTNVSTTSKTTGANHNADAE